MSVPPRTARPIAEVAEAAGLLPGELIPWGRLRAKIDATAVLERAAGGADGRLVCVTAVTPTALGEGKTTTAIGLADALTAAGARTILCLREPSLGPVFGRKGGGAGGGAAQLVPMEAVNLHLTGDIHAIEAATNLLASMLDASLIHGNPLRIDPASITWRRALDMNDRALRRIEVGRDPGTGGLPRESGFDIAAASEVMAIVSVAAGLADLRRRLGAITVAHDVDGRAVTAEALRAAGAMTVLLREALDPNLVQTAGGTPAIVHAGPFANIAHGNNSVLADRVALALGDVVVTESGFGADLGFEKLCDIVCRMSGLAPAVAVVVAGIATLRHHGGGDLDAGAGNLARHIEIVRGFGVRCVVAINRRAGDDAADLERACELGRSAGAVAAVVSDVFGRGGDGAAELAQAVLDAAGEPARLRLAYADDEPLAAKIRAVATRVYGAGAVTFAPAAARDLERLEAEGHGRLPVCIAKTPMSLSADPALVGAPSDFTLPVTGVRAYTGAGWVVALCGDVMLMPGLPDGPVAETIDIDAGGRTVGLF